MQAIEIDVDIAPDGSIHLPENYKAYFGRQARLIVLLPDKRPGDKQRYPLRGRPLRYSEPTRPVADDDWSAAQ